MWKTKCRSSLCILQLTLIFFRMKLCNTLPKGALHCSTSTSPTAMSQTQLSGYWQSVWANNYSQQALITTLFHCHSVSEPLHDLFPLHRVFLIVRTYINFAPPRRYCGSLHYLSLAYSTQFTSKGLQSITTGKGCRRLVYLDLSGCTHLSAEGMHSIGKGCPILNTLILDDIPDFTDAMIIKLVAHCHTLRHISFMGGGSLTDKAFKYLAMENKKLKTIKIESKF